MIDFKALGAAPDVVIANLCRIDLGDLVGTMQMHPALYGYAAVYAEKAKVAEIQAEAEMDRAKAEAFMDIAEADPSLPVNRLERMVLTSKKYKDAQEKFWRARRHAGEMRALVNGLDHRRDMLVQIASRQKKELANS